MNNNALYQQFIEELLKVAPDLDAEDIDANAHLMNDIGIDSMDFLNLVIALHKRFAVNIPEADYKQLATPAQAANYLQSHVE
jgi:acyl carrier protein